MHETPSFSLRAQSSGRAEVGLIGQHEKKFCLLAMRSLHDTPRRDLVRNVHCVASNALVNLSQRTDRSCCSYSCSPKKKYAKNRTQPRLREPIVSVCHTSFGTFGR